MAIDLKVDHYVRRVFLLGQSGAKVTEFDVPHLVLRRIDPLIILVELGTNDLAAGVRAPVVADSLQVLAQDLHHRYRAVVGVMSVLPRDKGLQDMTAKEFREEVQQLDDILKQCWVGSSAIFYHKHKGFWEMQDKSKKFDLPVSAWSKDGIHPNSERGRARYKSSLRTAIYKALKSLGKKC